MTARRLLVAGLLLLPAVLVFAPGLSYPFVALDDVYHVVENPGIRDLSPGGLRFLFFEDTRDLRYFPVFYLSLAIDYRLFGLDPFHFHLTNLLLHLVNTLLVGWLVERLFRDGALAFWTALLFSIHPLQVESVAWVISRKQVLFLCFFLLAAHAYLTHAASPAARPLRSGFWLGSSALLFLVACLSKTAAITLPAALVMADYALDPVARTSLAAWLRRSLPSKLVYLPVVAFVAWVSQRPGAPNPFRIDFGFSAWEWLLLIGNNFLFYVEKTILPLQLGAFYPLPKAGALPAHLPALSALGAALFGLAGLAWWRSWRVVVFGLGWYLVTIAPMAAFAAFFSDIPLLAADRYYYQSAIGLLVLPAAGLLEAWRRRPALRPLLALAAAAAVGTLCLLASSHRAAWRSTIALYEEILEHHPNDEFYYRLALEYAAVGRSHEALLAVDDAARAPSRVFFMDFLYYRMKLAGLHLLKGDLRGAADQLEAGLAATPNAFEPHDGETPLALLYLADLRERAGDAAGAARARDRASRASPDPNHYFETLWIQTLPAEAARFLGNRVAAHPDDAEAWFVFGMTAELAGDAREARARIDRALELGYRP